MKQFLVLCVALLVAACGVSLAYEWQHIGLAGHTVFSVASCADTGEVFAATNFGLYRRSEAEWETLYVYDPVGHARGFVQVDWPDVFLAWGRGSRSDGLWYSPDRGSTWQVLKYILWPSALEMGPHPNLLLLASDSANQGVWWSDDGGANWSEADSGLPTPLVHDFRFWSRGGDSVLCGTTGNGAYLSTNSGRSWQPLGPVRGRPARAVDWGWRIDAAAVLVGAGGPGDSCGIWCGLVNDSVWMREFDCPDVNDICEGEWAAVLGDSGIYFKHPDDGWVPAGEGLTNRQVHCVEVDDYSAWAGTEDGVFRYDYTPGVAEVEREQADIERRPAILLGSELIRHDGRVLDIRGCSVTSQRNALSPGVYFLRAPDGEGRASVRKVVVQR